MNTSLWALCMFPVLIVLLLAGYPVAFTLGAVALLFGWSFLGLDFFGLLPLRIWGVMTNFTLLAVPLFIFMGMLLKRSGLAVEMLETMGRLCGRVGGGLALATVLVGALLSATTGVVGATVVTLGVIAMPTMIRHGYHVPLAAGTVAAAGTLGQIIPPGIVLILLGDIMGVPIGRLFIAALVPGALLVGLYALYVLAVGRLRPQAAPAVPTTTEALFSAVLRRLLPVLSLVVVVLGSIFMGIASPTESAALGALGTLALAAYRRRLGRAGLQEALTQTLQLSSMVFMILIGATAFGLVFRGMGGEQAVLSILDGLPGGRVGFLVFSMGLIFLLGMFLDFLEICFIVIPVLLPAVHHFGIDPLWFAILVTVNLQTSFITPPFGFSIFYLKAVVPRELSLLSIYRGVVPFIIIQLLVLIGIAALPSVVLWLPDWLDRLHGL